MDSATVELGFPLTFREEDTTLLGEHLKLRHSVELVGMKRVGISNFLRFFLYKKGIVEKYIDEKEYHLFITVDLNDLVEIEIFPFWILTFKRLVDAMNASALDDKLKEQVSALFVDAIQSRDLFLTVDGLRKALILIVESGVMPTIFLLRFDRLEGVVNKQFFANLVGLRDATYQKLSYVFTSFRALDQIAPSVFERKMLSEFSHKVYIKPAGREDFKIILQSLADKYKLKLNDELENMLWEVCGGHVQYLHLAAIVLSKKQEEAKDQLIDALVSDERIKYLAEEIWESLNSVEQEVLLNSFGGKIGTEEKKEGRYLWDCGIIDDNNRVFGSLFEDTLKKHGGNGHEEKVDFTKKEQLLYNYLLKNKGEVCEREQIIEAV